MCYEIFTVFKEMTVDLQYIFVPKSQVWNEDHTILTWLLCVFWWRVPMPFIWCLWGFDILVLDSSKSRTPQLGTDRSWYRARSSGICWYTYIDEMLDIYLLSDWWSDEKSQRTHLKLYGNRMNVQVWCLSKAMNILFLVRFGHFFTLYVYAIPY